jgi:membrane-associated phospholipid phosphatase
MSMIAPTTTPPPADRTDSSHRSILEWKPDEHAESSTAHRFRPAVLRMVVGYLVLTVVLLGIGFLLVHPLNNSVGRWDEHVNESLARHRTNGWNDVTKFATSAVNTLPVIVLAALVAGVLALLRRIREAVFLILALILEITVFLSVTFVVARPRPDVPRLNSTPSTSSFPSGHTAAATVLCVGVALIVMCCTTNRGLRVLGFIVAATIAALVGFARVYRGLHHPTDVIVGALYGLACLAVAAHAVAAVPERHRSRAGAVPPAVEDAGA